MFITVRDARIYATSFGSIAAPPILGLGGWIGNWELWAEPFAILSASWRTLAFDHRGSGATVAPVESITFEQLVDDVFAVMDAYEVERCVLAAESMGAAIALGAALKHPQRVSGLVIVDGFYHADERSGQDMFLAGLRSDYARTLEHFVNTCVPEPDCDHIKHWGRQILDRATQPAAVALYVLAGSVDLRNRVSQISQPTLILHGEADALVPVQQAQWLAQAIPNARLTILNGAGHVPTMTRPHEVAREITSFFPATM